MRAKQIPLILLGTLAWCGLLVASAQAQNVGGSGGGGVDQNTGNDTGNDTIIVPPPSSDDDSTPIIVPPLPPSSDDGSTSVPEPTSVLALLALGGIAASLRKSRKR